MLRGLEHLMYCCLSSLVGGCIRDGTQAPLDLAENKIGRQTAAHFSKGNWTSYK